MRMLLALLVVTLFACHHAPPAAAPASATSADGVTLAIEERGPRDAPAIVFVHGLGFSHEVWHRQLEGELATRYHLVAYDLRGHGRSSRPTEPVAYQDGARWGQDLAAVIAATHARNPVVVGWSLGGIPIMEYAHAGGALGGAVFVDAVTKFAADVFPPENAALVGALTEPDDARRAAATRAFAGACFVTPPPELDALLAKAGTLPAFEHAAIQKMQLTEPEATLRALRVPTLVVHGAHERLVAETMSRYTTSAVPGATLSVYDRSGHAPFLDETARFDAELGRFVAKANAQ